MGSFDSGLTPSLRMTIGIGGPSACDLRPYSPRLHHLHLPVLFGGRMRRVILLACAVFLTISAVAQAKHPFTFEDMMSLKRVGEPEPSPDGKWVLFSAVDVDLNGNTRTPHVWILPLETQPQTQGPSTAQGSPSATPASVGMTGEREIIKDQDADRPRWAPDGKRFLFVSKKDGGAQVWIADFDSATGTVTATHKLTSIATEADG